MRPSALPRWADTVPAARVVPTTGKLDVGWAIDERPPAKYMNWLFHTIYEWITWLANAGNSIRAASGGFADVAGWARSSDGFVQSSTPTSTWIVPLDLAIGTVVTSVRFRCLPNGATSTITCSILKSVDETQTTVASAVSTAGSGSPEWVTVASSFTVAATEFYSAKFEASGVGGNQRRASLVELNP